MTVQVQAMLKTVAQELYLSQEELLGRGTRGLLERQLREIKAEIFQISGRYGISSVEEMEARYRDGTLEEADSWRDLQRLDHLEYKRDRLLKLLETLFPKHFHNASETNVVESHLSEVPEEALREFLSFVRDRMHTSSGSSQ